MPLTIDILQSKLTMPRLANTTQRDRLYPLIKEIHTKKLIAVIAGAGYGKTTLIAQAAQHLNIDTLWYRLDSADSDFTTFISYLIAGIQKYHPQVGEKTSQRIEQALVLNREHEAILRVFIQEIEACLTRDLLIVLDDFHSISNSREIKDCLYYLLETMPSKLHVALISRTDPGLSLSRLRSTLDVIDISEDNLAFTTVEIYQLYCQLFAIGLTDESLKIIYTKTGGWVAGLILLYHYSRGKSPEDIKGFLLNLKGSQRFIANYLEENVYNMLSDEVKDFLCKTSILSRLNAGFCDQLLSITNSREILRSLEEDRLFTFPFDEDRQWYYYHHLFQEFLQTRLYELDKKTVDDLHKKAAVLWETGGEEEEALRHYIAASELVTACKLLGTMGRRKLLKEGRLQLINSFIKELPEELLREDPWIQYIRARVFELSGKPFDAIHTYRKAHASFIGLGNTRHAETCLKGLGYNYFIIGDFQGAEIILKELLGKAQDNPRLRFDILGLLILISSHLGKMSDTDEYYSEAMSILPSLNDPSLAVWINFNQGFRYGCSGDYEDAARLGKKVKEAFLKLEFTLYLAMTYHLLSWSNYYLGSFSQGLDHAEDGLRLADDKGINDTTRGWLLMDYALNAMGLQRYDDAVGAAQQALENFQELECRWGQSYISHVLQLIYAKTGDYSRAEKYALSGLEAIKDLELPMDKGFIKASLAGMLLELGRLDEAGPMLEEAQRDLQPTKLFYCQAYLWRARYYWEKNREKDAVKMLLSGLNLAEANHYDFWVACERHWIIPLLAEAFSQNRMQDYIRTILHKAGIAALHDLKQLQMHEDHAVRAAAAKLLDEILKRHRPGLRIHCLGKFRFFKGDEEIPEERWASKKAKTLFKILICERDRGFLPKDILMEYLWPEQDPDRIINRFHVALSSLRKTLEPELPKGTPSTYLLRNKDSYRIDLGDTGWVDAELFIRYARQATQESDQEARITLYLEAEKLYQGAFLQEDLYDHWCIDKRELIREEYISILIKIINHFEAKADYERCIHYALKYLATDRYAEHIYQDLMRYYSLTNNKGMVIKTYEKCRENLDKGLDSCPSSETEELYNILISL